AALLVPIRPVANVISKVFPFVDLAEVDFANGKPNAIANIVRGLRAGSRTPAHNDSHESSPTRALDDSNEFIAAVRIFDLSMREWLPLIIVIDMQVHRIVSGPVFDAISCGVRHRPMNPNSVYRLRRTQIDHRPSRMRIFVLDSEMRIEVRIAFPKRVVVAIGNT